MKSYPQSAGLLVLLAALAALGPLSTDLYLASLPLIRDSFDADIASVQLTLSVYLISFALGQLFFGSLSDQFGRKPVMLGGAVLYGTSGLACAFAGSVEQLIFFRFLQAMGAAACIVVSRAATRDIYGREKSAKVMSQIGSIMAIAPLVGPIMGGYLTVAFGWQSNFLVLAIYGAITAAALAFGFRESIPARDPGAFHPGRMLVNFGHLLRHRQYLGYVLTSCFCYGGLFAFISGSSFVLIDFFRIDPDRFGYFFASIVAGYVTGTVIGSRFGPHLGIERTVLLGSIVTLISGGAMAVMAITGPVHVAAVILPMILYMVGLGMVLPTSLAGALGPFAHMAGAASALSGSSTFAFAALVGAAVGRLHQGDQVVMALAIGLCGVMTFASFALLVLSGARRTA